jgi:hypothetical protein
MMMCPLLTASTECSDPHFLSNVCYDPSPFCPLYHCDQPTYSPWIYRLPWEWGGGLGWTNSRSTCNVTHRPMYFLSTLGQNVTTLWYRKRYTTQLNCTFPNSTLQNGTTAEQVFENVTYAENWTSDLHVWTTQRLLTTRPLVLVEITTLSNRKNCSTVAKVLYSTGTSPFWGQRGRKGKVSFVNQQMAVKRLVKFNKTCCLEKN